VGMKIIGAGLGRTGTTSLKSALEHLLGAPCYHMATLFQRPEHVAPWHAAAEGRMPDWPTLLDGFAAITDWPGSAFYQDLMQAFPEAKVLLSWREPEAWLQSCRNTIFPKIVETEGAWGEMIRAVIGNSFGADLNNDQACLDAYQRHADNVKKTVPAKRLIVWTPDDGWAPICRALELPIPEVPFPHLNTTETFGKKR
jgi:hypothetical protein